MYIILCYYIVVNQRWCFIVQFNVLF